MLEDKRGMITDNQPLLPNPLGIYHQTWVEITNNCNRKYQCAVGSLDELACFSEHAGRCWGAKKNEFRRYLH